MKFFDNMDKTDTILFIIGIFILILFLFYFFMMKNDKPKIIPVVFLLI